MAHYSSTSTGELRQCGPSCDSQHPARSLFSISYQLLTKIWPIGKGSSSTRTHIHLLDNDSLLNIFHLCRPAPHFSDENEADFIRILGGGNLNHERWWRSLIQVCRRWRYLVLESASFLGLSLLCTYGTPVADMLAYLPPLPLIIDYHDLYDELTADDELGITLALEHCDRVRRIRLMQPVPVLQELLVILQGEFPNLEYLIERHPFGYGMTVDFPITFRAPRLLYFAAMGLPTAIVPPFATMGNTVALSLAFGRGDYIHPNVLLQQLSAVPQRETSGNTFDSFLPSDEFDIRLLQRLIKGLLPRVAIRLLERLQLYIFDQLTYLKRLHFMHKAEIPRLETVTLAFIEDHSRVYASSRRFSLIDYTFSMSLGSGHLDLQVARTAQFFTCSGQCSL
ncbi:hypothetical protein BGY98DRAFT_482263 [Russula aff. rugulosa BPL654]|nr:hypothetical protein BGY98DRAFT_482263 [Russula aff. rugulosa BPL654]